MAEDLGFGDEMVALLNKPKLKVLFDMREDAFGLITY